MAQSRSYFTTELKGMGFTAYEPAGDIFKYIPREFLRCDQITVAISPKGSAIEVSVYHTTRQSIKKFDDYSGAWNYVNNLRKAPPPVILPPTKAKTIRRR